MAWYVLYSKPKSEKKAAQELHKLGVKVYCPIITEVRQWSDRKKKVEVPLFRSYIFVQLPEKKRNIVFEVPYVQRYLFWLGKPAIVRDAEIETLKEWLENDQIDELAVEKLSEGDHVKIAKGAFKDKEAIVSKIGSKRMRLLMPGLGCSVSVKISDIL